MVKALILAVLLAGCAPVSLPIDNPREIWCRHNEPRRDATVETPRSELDRINAHNAKGVEWCGWHP